MKPSVISLILSAFLVLCCEYVIAQSVTGEQLQLNIQIRPRGEIRHGLFTPILKSQEAASFVAQRSRLGLIYSRQDKLKIGLTTQIINVWGNDAQVQATGNTLTLYEAWAQYFFSPHWNIKAGRQVLSFDDERILGALDWNNAGRKHDAVLVGFNKNKWQVNAGVAYNQNAESITGGFYDNSMSQPYKSLQFIWTHYESGKDISFSFIGMNNSFQSRMDSLNSYLQTVGGNFYFNKNKWKSQATAYYQLGKNHKRDVAAFNTSAWMAAIKINYTLNKYWELNGGADYLSGKKMDDQSLTITNFNPLYGTHHKFYGNMDYFYVSSGHHNVGLVDIYAGATAKITPELSSQLAVHRFSAAAKVVGTQQNSMSKYLGTEADLGLSYKLLKDVNVSGGYSQMFTSPSMKILKNIPSSQILRNCQNWIWLMININPQIILKSK